METDFRLASKKFWQTVRRLRKGKQGLAQAVFSRGGELLTQTEDIVGRWKEHFEELLNLANTSSEEEAESEASGEAPPISLAEVAEVVKQLFKKIRYEQRRVRSRFFLSSPSESFFLFILAGCKVLDHCYSISQLFRQSIRLCSKKIAADLSLFPVKHARYIFVSRQTMATGTRTNTSISAKPKAGNSASKARDQESTSDALHTMTDVSRLSWCVERLFSSSPEGRAAEKNGRECQGTFSGVETANLSAERGAEG